MTIERGKSCISSSLKCELISIPIFFRGVIHELPPVCVRYIYSPPPVERDKHYKYLLYGARSSIVEEALVTCYFQRNITFIAVRHDTPCSVFTLTLTDRNLCLRLHGNFDVKLYKKITLHNGKLLDNGYRFLQVRMNYRQIDLVYYICCDTIKI